jgi:hypothetical protein
MTRDGHVTRSLLSRAIAISFVVVFAVDPASAQISAEATRDVPVAGGGTEVTPLFELLARINGEPLALAAGANVPDDRKPDDRKPVICFPRGVSAFSASAWRAAPDRYHSAEWAIREVGRRIARARAASEIQGGAPALRLRVIGFADPTAESTPTGQRVDEKEAHEDNLRLSLARADAIADALRRQPGLAGATIEVEGRGSFHPRPTDPESADADASIFLRPGTNERFDKSCADFQPPSARSATEMAPAETAANPQGRYLYVASQRRVEIEVLTASLTHVGHRLTIATSTNEIDNDARLRAFPAGAMPARPVTLDLALVEGADFLGLGQPTAPPAARCGRPDQEPMANPHDGATVCVSRALTSGWRRIAEGTDADDLQNERAISALDSLDGGASLRVDIFPVWRRDGRNVARGVRVALTLARQPRPTRPPESPASIQTLSRGLGVPGFWAVHQRLHPIVAGIVGDVGSPIVTALGELKKTLRGRIDPTDRQTPRPSREAADRLRRQFDDLESLIDNQQRLRDLVMALLPRDLDGMLLDAHRFDRSFRFFDLSPGMTLRYQPTRFDPALRLLQPEGPSEFRLVRDPLDPCARIPTPRRLEIGDRRDVAINDPFLAAIRSGYRATTSGTGEEAIICGTSAQRVLRPSTMYSPTRYPWIPNLQHVGRLRPLESIAAFDRLISRQGTPRAVRVFAPLGPLAHAAIRDTDATYAIHHICDDNLSTKNRDCYRQNWIFLPNALETEDDAQTKHQSTILFAVPEIHETLDTPVSARPRRFRLGGSLESPYAPCIDQIRCYYLSGGHSVVPAIRAIVDGREEYHVIGTKFVHVLPNALTRGCFANVASNAATWAPDSRLARPIDFLGVGRNTAAARGMLVDRRDCRLLGLFVTAGSRVSW